MINLKNSYKLRKQLFTSVTSKFCEKHSGVRIGGSSDAPIEDLDPLTGMYDVIMRRNDAGDVFNRDECFTFDEAVELYTAKSAYVDGVEKFRGSIERGFDADLVVMATPTDDQTGIPVNLNENAELIKRAKVRMTYVKGEVAYKASS